ncbi:polysaccharide biosynthesis/export family protein [Bradyrhizobium sp.]|uniref:polysaccharide biosynthesis/export family protein n=1 Tax=Bradyrhizobium sp. TaxID=376 RepID=UPI0039E53F1F
MKTFCKIAMALSLAWAIGALATPVWAADYKLGVSDRVKIKVQEWPDINGEYTLNADGVVSLPLVGNINAIGLRPSELGLKISELFKKRSGGSDQILTAVEIAQYRPFSIMGDVQKSGQYPYRPGLTVLEAVSIAGGYYRPETGPLRIDRDVAIASGEINTMTIKLNRMLVHEARLGAALAGRDDFSLPPELFKLKDDPETQNLMKSEQAALSLEIEMKKNEQASFEAVKSLYHDEIETLDGQVQALGEEKESIGTQLSQLRSMAAKGLALSPTMFALERSYAQVVNQQMSAGTAIVRAKENITVSEQRMNQFQQERSRLNSKDLQQTRDAIAETRAKIETAFQLLDEAQTSAPNARVPLDRVRSGFTIFRKDGETIRQIPADETTLVSPDDVVKIPAIRAPIAISSNSRGSYRTDPPDR